MSINEKNQEIIIHEGQTTLEEFLPETAYIAALSGGKDSTVMCDLLLKNGYPLDYIVFQDTFMEFDFMYKYINKLEKYFKRRYNKEITRLKPKTTFEEWCFGVIKDSNAKCYEHIRGIPMVWSEPCYWRRESKQVTSDLFVKENNITNAVWYIGFTLGENRKINNTDKQSFEYPLKDIFKLREIDCQKYLLDQDMENPLYKYFNRTGCFMCPAQSDRSWYQVWKNFPDDWAYMKWIEKRLLKLQSMGYKVKNCYWFTDFRTCDDMEKKFKLIDKQGSLFDFSDEPLKDCFCKI